MEAQAVALVGHFWTQAADMIGDLWPILAFPVGLGAAFSVGRWMRGLV